MTSIFALGFLMGLRHACEADHLAAMATLATRGRGWRSGLWLGAAWGVGHTLTLLAVGAVCLLLGKTVPERWAFGLEFAVGVMLVLLGGDVVLRARRRRLHVHVHGHADGSSHWHAHAHAPEAEHDEAAHAHAHGLPGRALLVGLVHGLAGSAALFLLTLEATPSLLAGLVYIGLFGLGSLLGMALLSLAISFPLQASARRFAGFQSVLELSVGLMSVGVGLQLLHGLVS